MGVDQRGSSNGPDRPAGPAGRVGGDTAGDGAAVNARVGAVFDGAAIAPPAGSNVELSGRPDVGPAPRDVAAAAADAPRAFPSEQADARAQHWELQGGQYRNYEGTCGLAASAGILSEQTGEPFSEAEVVRHATEHGLCDTEAQTSDPDRLGGTTMPDLAVLHGDAGLESRVETGQNQADLASAVDRGDGVIAAVNCADYWPAEAFESPEAREQHRTSERQNHAVWVTGVSRSPEGEITGFYVNDTGIADGAARFVSSNDWARAWQARGGDMVVSRRPT